MLTLSKDSWHYNNFEAWRKNTKSRFHMDLHSTCRLEYDPELGYKEWKTRPLRQPDLCTYTRIALIWGPIHRVRRFVRRNEWIQIALFSLVCYGLLAVVGAVIAQEHGYGNWFMWVFPLFFAAGAFAMILGAWGIMALFHTLRRKYQETYQGVPRRSGASLVPEYVKAKKRKICPLIEFEEQA